MLSKYFFNSAWLSNLVGLWFWVSCLLLLLLDWSSWLSGEFQKVSTIYRRTLSFESMSSSICFLLNSQKRIQNLADSVNNHVPRFCFNNLGSKVEHYPLLLKMLRFAGFEPSSETKVTTFSLWNRNLNLFFHLSASTMDRLWGVPMVYL